MGKVFYNNQELGTVYYRLNAYNDEIELKKTNLDEEKQLALVKNNEIKIVTTNREIVMRSFKDLKNKLKEGYLSLIYSGSKYLVYKRIDKKFSEPKPAANSMVNPIPSKFTDYISYYYQKKENEGINEIPLKNKKFLKEIINENTDAIKKFMRINDSNLNNEADLLAVFRFLNGE